MKLINRHIVKTISWRIVGTADTILLSWLITGDMKAGLQIGLADVTTKMLLYYLHERVWFKSSVVNANKRHIYKTITWRVIGTLDTVVLSMWIWGDAAHSFQIGGVETLTKSVLYYFHEKMWYRIAFGVRKYREERMAEKLHIIPHQHAISTEDRQRQNGHKGHVLWFTGLSGSGKSTVASSVERELHQQGIKTFILDGDNVRAGLNSDLDFSAASREENIRRIAHVSALMKDAGLVVLSAFVSPYHKDRNFVRECAGNDFSEIFISTPLEVCEQRDVKGLYAKARSGEISNFTGISAPFEEPTSPELDVPTHEMSIEQATAMVVDYIITKIALDK